MQLVLNQSAFAGISKFASRFGTWWFKELLNLLPDRFAGIGAGQEAAQVGHRRHRRQNQLELSGETAGQQVAERLVSGNVWMDIDAFLSSHRLARQDVDIGLRLPEESVFGREFVLPVEARDAIDAIAAQDLAKKTPFKLETPIATMHRAKTRGR